MKVNRLNIYLTGNTVRLEAEFRNLQGQLIDVDFPKLIIYDYKYNKIAEYPLTASNKSGTGKYFYNYETSESPKKLIYEFYGELDGLPTIDRKMFSTKFI
jgi:hypothetical protein